MEIPRTFALHFRKASCLCVWACVWVYARMFVYAANFSPFLSIIHFAFLFLSILFALSIRTNNLTVWDLPALTHTHSHFITLHCCNHTHSEPICQRIAYSIFIVYLEVSKEKEKKRSHVASAIPHFGLSSLSLIHSCMLCEPAFRF